MTALRSLVEAVAFRALLAAARVVPRRPMLALGSAAGTVGYALDRRHRRIALDNVRAAFGDSCDGAAAGRLVRSCWRHFGRITLDALTFPRRSADDAGSVVRYEGIEHIRGAYEGRRGVILFSAHFGHWELVALMQGWLGLPLTLVTRRLDNPRLEAMVASLRCRSGNRLVHKSNAVREMRRTLARGSGIAILIDQDARAGGVFVPFFGRPASTTPTPALLALRTGASLIPVFSLPEADGGWRVVYEPPVTIEPSGDRERDVEALTAKCTAIVETWVRRHPELWLWMHRRWKTRPPG